MITPDLVNYVKAQMNAGFSPDQIRSVLINEGWSNEEISEAFAAARGPAGPGPLPAAQPGVKRHKAVAGFIVSLIGGFFVFVHAIIMAFLGSIIGDVLPDAFDAISVFAGFLGEFLLILGIIGIILGIGMIVGAVLIYKQGREKIGGILVLIFSIVSLLSINGFLVGAILGIIGGILGILKK